MIAALLEHWNLLPKPLMYLSAYLKAHQRTYYQRLSDIRTEGDWESWIHFFLKGVVDAASDAERSVLGLDRLLASDRQRLLAQPKLGTITMRLFEQLPVMPRFTVEHVCQRYIDFLDR